MKIGDISDSFDFDESGFRRGLGRAQITISGIIANPGSCFVCGRPRTFDEPGTSCEVPSDNGPTRIDGVAIPQVVEVCPECAKSST